MLGTKNDKWKKSVEKLLQAEKSIEKSYIHRGFEKPLRRIRCIGKTAALFTK